ncbi:MAG: hypothetical protein QXT45_05510 [Candidatus Bilamarchaeaceae archaeon]
MPHIDISDQLLFRIESALASINEKVEFVSELRAAISRLENNVERLINIVEAPANIERSLLARVSAIEHDIEVIKAELHAAKQYKSMVMVRTISALIAGVLLGILSSVLGFGRQ